MFHWPQTALLLLCTQSELTRFWALETDWNADKSRSLAFYCWVWEIFSNNQTVCSYYIYLDVSGKLTQEIFYELHRIKDLSPAFSNFSFLRTSTNERCTLFVEPTGFFWLGKAVKQVSHQEGPGSCLNWFILTFWPAIFGFIFYFLSCVYIPSRLGFSHATLFPAELSRSNLYQSNTDSVISCKFQTKCCLHFRCTICESYKIFWKLISETNNSKKKTSQFSFYDLHETPQQESRQITSFNFKNIWSLKTWHFNFVAFWFDDSTVWRVFRTRYQMMCCRENSYSAG